jgi:hypothetical protein
MKMVRDDIVRWASEAIGDLSTMIGIALMVKEDKSLPLQVRNRAAAFAQFLAPAERELDRLGQAMSDPMAQ